MNNKLLVWNKRINDNFVACPNRKIEQINIEIYEVNDFKLIVS